jgi:hypothetical protein
VKPGESKQFFESSLSQQGLLLPSLTAGQACKAMLDFYRLHRADGCDVSTDGDMVLYQWDLLDSEEHGRCLEWNLTRQFMLAEISDEESDDAHDDEEEVDAADSPDDDDSSDDEAIWQLALTMRFPLNDSAEALAAGNKWRPTPRSQAVDHFEKFIRESPAYKLAATQRAASVELDFFNAE